MNNILKDLFYKLGIYKEAKRYLKKPYLKYVGFKFRLTSKEAIKIFLEVMNKNNIKYWLEFGTLLGAIRENGLIKHDNDFDVAMFIDDRNSKLIEDSLKSHGFRLIKRAYLTSGEIIEETYQYKTAHIDIFYAYKEQDRVKIYDYQTFNNLSPNECIKKYGGLKVFENSLTAFDLERYNFMGFKVWIPDNYSNHLEELYGENYLVPNRNWSLNSREIRSETNELAVVKNY